MVRSATAHRRRKRPDAAVIGLVLAAIPVLTATARAAEYHVSPAGSDKNPGTATRPFSSIQKAADAMVAGDVCFVREGAYRETVVVKKPGEKGKPMRFAAYPGEVVTLNGTDPLIGDWRIHKGKIYKTTVSRGFDQLFVDGKMMIEARWPNMRFEEIWDRSKWAQATPGSCYGKLVDPALAGSGVDWTGGLAMLNVMHQFFTWTRPVVTHEAERDFFTFPKDFGKWSEVVYAKRSRYWEDDRYYLYGKLLGLDNPTEWFLDRKTRTLYLWTDDGANPGARNVEAKTRDYAFIVEGRDYVELAGFHFFGATFCFRKESSHCLVENCHLLFPNYPRELLDSCAKPKRAVTARTLMHGDYNVVRNSSLAYSPTMGLQMIGCQSTVENCLVHDVCWVGSLDYAPIQLRRNTREKSSAAQGIVARRNTVFNFGNAGLCFYKQPGLVEYNHVYSGGLTCKDVALVYTENPTIAGSVVRYNWVHGCRTEDGYGLGVRGDDLTRGLSVHHNVVWDCGAAGIIVKGDGNAVYNNTVLYIGTKEYLGAYVNMPTRAEPNKPYPWQKVIPHLDVQNLHSPVRNNAARTLLAQRGKRDPITPAENLSNNYTGEDLRLVDAPRLDFRPEADSPLVDAGLELPGFTDGFKGKAPDIGAYEFGGEHWKPGHHNGIRLVAGKRGPSLALAMPIMEPVDMLVSPIHASATVPAQRLRFTPRNWMQPQMVRSHGIRAAVRHWGNVEIADTRKSQTVWFPQPDIGKLRPMAHRFNTLERGGRPLRRQASKPVARAFMAIEPIRVDGRIGPDEWPGWNPMRTLRLMDIDACARRAGEALVQRDADSIYVAFRVRLADPAAAARAEGRWGVDEGVEVDFRTRGRGKTGPTLILHGYPSGKLECLALTDKGRALLPALRRAVCFAAHVHTGMCTAEFRIPLAALGREVKAIEKLHFNLGAYVKDEHACPWFCWANTGDANYELDTAGELAWTPTCRVTAKNILLHGDFEAGDIKPWRLGHNVKTAPERVIMGRIHEGPDRDWCIRLECGSPQTMTQGVISCAYSVKHLKLGPGTYVLSYDLRVADLQRPTNSGMACCYIGHWYPKEGRNSKAILLPGRFIGRDVPWTRRENIISVPEGAQLSHISLQLHKAAGTVWYDNVSLRRCVAIIRP